MDCTYRQESVLCTLGTGKSKSSFVVMQRMTFCTADSAVVDDNISKNKS